MTKEKQHQIYLDQQNHITLFPVQQSLEEAAMEYSTHLKSMPEFEDAGGGFIEMVYKAGAEWERNNKPEPECILGVGDGKGKLFVHGSHEAIKRVQSMIFELEELRKQVKDK